MFLILLNNIKHKTKKIQDSLEDRTDRIKGAQKTLFPFFISYPKS